MNAAMNKHTVSTGWRYLASGAAVFGVAVCLLIFGAATASAEMPNACPVDGCDVKIASVARAGQELEVTFSSNFKR